jgi:hypothetical protein
VQTYVQTKGAIMTSLERHKKYINSKKKQGQKRVSFFVEEKVWKYFKKRSDTLSPNEYLKKLLNFK